ncbi:MAG: aminotransferase class V-fold PLP-dependent enzyme [Gemmatimonadetes bacterium]|nr:aminotransferase class V-fold PLP-dependent enzyme [Gemmatimonadota bacterium]
MNLSEARELFPGVQDQVYLNVSLNGLMPFPSRDAVLAHLDKRVMGKAVKEELHAQAERVRELVAGLIGADPVEVAITKNVSEGLNIFASGLDWRPGDNVVFCPELEHPNNVFLWYHLRETKGVEIREILPEAGHIPLERMVEAMDDRTRVATVSHVTFSPGFITDVQALATEARSRGVLTLIDSAQSAGSIRTDVRELGVDAISIGTQKNLLAFYGLGFLYVRKDLAESLNPVFVARYGMDLGPDAHETAISPGTLDFRPGALRFELSNYNYIGLAAVEPSLELIHSLGMDQIEPHVRGLAARLAKGMLAAGLPVAGGEPGPHLAHIVAVGESGGGRHYSADDPAMNELFHHLVSNGVTISIRRGILRMSVGLYNDEADIDRVVELSRSWVG